MNSLFVTKVDFHVKFSRQPLCSEEKKYKVTAQTCSKIINSVREKEDTFSKEDKLIDEKNESCAQILSEFC